MRPPRMVAEARSVQLTGAQFAAVWRECTPTEYPLVLGVESHGSTLTERERVLAAARTSLVERGQWDHTGPASTLVGAVEALSSPQAELDSRAVRMRAIAATNGPNTVLVVAGADGVLVTPVSAFSMPAAILSTVPAAQPGFGQLNVRTDELRLATAAAGADARRLGAALRELGAQARSSDHLAAALTTIRATARIGAAARRGGVRHRAARIVALADTDHGRYVVGERRSPDRTAWTTWLPATSEVSHRAVAELLAEVVGPAVDGGTELVGHLVRGSRTDR